MSEKRALVGNAADEQQVAKAQAKEQDQRRKILDAFRDVLDTQAGRRVVWHLLSHCSPYRNSFTSDPYVTAFNEGHRSVAGFILAEINEAVPGIYIKMQQEHLKGDA